jgi:hypothetical protein
MMMMMLYNIVCWRFLRSFSHQDTSLHEHHVLKIFPRELIFSEIFVRFVTRGRLRKEGREKATTLFPMTHNPLTDANDFWFRSRLILRRVVIIQFTEFGLSW